MFLVDSWTAAIGPLIVIFRVVVAIVEPVIERYGPNEVVGRLNQLPSGEHLLGTDQLMRDVLSRLLGRIRPIPIPATFSVACAVAVGITLALTAGFFGGLVDAVIIRVLDAVVAFPALLLCMIIIAAIGALRAGVVLAITIGGGRA